MTLTGFLLLFFFQTHIERRFDLTLFDHIEEFIAASELTETGDLFLSWEPVYPSFNQNKPQNNKPQNNFFHQPEQPPNPSILNTPLWYWQIIQNGHPVAGSKKLQLSDKLKTLKTDIMIFNIQSPEQIPLRAMAKKVIFSNHGKSFIYIVAGPVSDIKYDIEAFRTIVLETLTTLAIFLISIIPLHVRFTLRPLEEITNTLQKIRSGQASKLPSSVPKEVKPLVHGVNTLLNFNTESLQRARNRAGNLAHGIKTPISIMNNELRNISGESSNVIRQQIKKIQTILDHKLSQERTSGACNILGTQTPVDEIIEDLQITLENLFMERSIIIHTEGLNGLIFNGESQDFEEMIGNLMENACKWAKSKVLVRVAQKGGCISITVEDDGPGIPEHFQLNMTDRGKRLDDATPGSGLGLHIVQEIVELYNGNLTNGRASLGGTAVTIDLPGFFNSSG